MKRFAFHVMPVLVVAVFVSALAVGSTAHAAASAQTAMRSHAHHHAVYFPTRQHWQKTHKGHVTPYYTPGGSGDLQWYGGPVEENPVVYVIFWGPNWSGSDYGAANVVQSYFYDMGGTSFENILTQYYDNYAYVANSNNVAGVWFDSSNAPTDSSCGGATVEDSSIQNEVANAINANGWPTDGSNATYFVYTPSGEYVNSGGSCSDTSGGFCAYHNWSGSVGVAYAAMAYPVDMNGCGIPSSPNGNAVGDALTNVTSHEQFEAITDPAAGNGWIDAAGYEIGDKCAWDFSAGYTYLNGGTFELQTEYSNATSSCVSSY